MAYEIIKPCTEDWRKMTPVKGGRFCDKCQKKVYDLTNSPPLANADQEICGIKHQSNTQIIPYQQKIAWHKQTIRYVAALLTLLTSRYADAQITNAESPDASLSNKTVLNDENKKTIVLEGNLEDKKTKEPIPFAAILVLDEHNKQVGGALTDINGNYKLELKDIKGKYLSIKAAYIGYQIVIVKDIPLTSPKQKINIKLNTEDVSLGLISVGAIEWTNEFDAFGQKRAIDRNEWNHSPK